MQWKMCEGCNHNALKINIVDGLCRECQIEKRRALNMLRFPPTPEEIEATAQTLDGMIKEGEKPNPAIQRARERAIDNYGPVESDPRMSAIYKVYEAVDRIAAPANIIAEIIPSDSLLAKNLRALRETLDQRCASVPIEVVTVAGRDFSVLENTPERKKSLARSYRTKEYGAFVFWPLIACIGLATCAVLYGAVVLLGSLL